MAKRRDANFTREEADKLVELVQQYLDVILNNKCTSEVNRQKDDAWNLIAEEFNSYTTNHRTPKQLRHKLENMKKRSELKKLHLAKSVSGDGKDDSEHDKWLKRVQQSQSQSQDKDKDKSGEDTGEDWGEGDDSWGEERERERDSREEPSEKKLKIQTIYVKPLPTLNCTDNTFATEVKRNSDCCQDDGSHLCASTLGGKKFYSQTQIAELFKIECKHKQEKQKQQLEHEKKLQEAQLNKLALEARIYEAQLNKTNLEVKQLSRKLQREEELHSARMKREAEIHSIQLERCRDGQHSVSIKENVSDD